MKQYLIIPALALLTACGENKQEQTSKTTEEPITEIAKEDHIGEPVKDTLADAIFNEAAQETPTAPAPKPKATMPKLDTLCYIMTEGENNKNINAVRIILLPDDNIIGELKYITKGQPPAEGALEGSIKHNIIKANWTFIKNDTNYYQVPVEFKLAKDAIYQKPSALDDQGKPYVPKDGEYSFKFDKTDCKYYPE